MHVHASLYVHVHVYVTMAEKRGLCGHKILYMYFGFGAVDINASINNGRLVVHCKHLLYCNCVLWYAFVKDTFEINALGGC